MTSETENQSTSPHVTVRTMPLETGQEGANRPDDASVTAYAPSAPEPYWLFACQKYQERKMAMRPSPPQRINDCA